MNAFCTACSFASPMPSTVVTDFPAAARDIDQKRVGVIGEGRGAAVDRHRAHLRSPGFLREDFFAMLRFTLRGFADAPMAPAISVRSMISRSLKKAPAGCIFGCADLAPLTAISTYRQSSPGAMASTSFCLRRIRSIGATPFAA